MDEQEFLHRLSVDYNLNIELLKDVIHDDKLFVLIKAKKQMDAIMYLRKTYLSMDLAQAKIIVDKFTEEFG